jgi:hypothetical protein
MPRLPVSGAPAEPRPCPIPVEQVGRGARCLDPTEAAQRRAEPGASLDAAGRVTGRMAPERLLALEVKLDVNRASLEELVALPEVGTGLARAIIARRTGHPLRCREALQRVPGLGAHRADRLLPFLLPLPSCGPQQHVNQ